MLRRHAAGVLTSATHWGESVTLHPLGGAAAVYVQASVARRGEQRTEDGRVLGWLAEVLIPRSSVAGVGVESIQEGAEVEFAMVPGEEPARHRIERIASQDGGGFLLRVWS